MNPLVACCEQRRDVLGLETLRNVLRAIHVPGLDGETDDLFRPGVVTLGQRGDLLFVALDDDRRTQIFMRLRCA